MIVFPVLIPGQNFLFPGTGREITKCHGKGREGKFEACIPGNHGKQEFPLTPDWLTMVSIWFTKRPSIKKKILIITRIGCSVLNYPDLIEVDRRITRYFCCSVDGLVDSEGQKNRTIFLCCVLSCSDDLTKWDRRIGRSFLLPPT